MTIFPKRNSSRVVLRSRNKLTTEKLSSPRLKLTTETPKVTRRVLRRKITKTETTRVPTTTASATRATSKTTNNYQHFSQEIDDEVASILPAITSAKPRKTTKPTLIETTTRTLENFTPKVDKISSFDDILEHQYKIKGIDMNSYENYDQDERLIGVLGSQVLLT